MQNNEQTSFINILLQSGKLLGKFIRMNNNQELFEPDLRALHVSIVKTSQINSWFTLDHSITRIEYISKYLCESLKQDISIHRKIPFVNKKIGIIIEDRIPFEFFPFFITFYISGCHQTYIGKTRDDGLIQAFVKFLERVDSGVKNYISFSERIPKDTQALVMNEESFSADLIRKYIKNKPVHFIKKRTGIAVLKGDESAYQLGLLAKDVLLFFGMGKENVKKVYIPVNYDFSNFFHATEEYHEIINHNKYANNYQYHQSLYLFNRIPFLDNGFLIVKEDKSLFAPTGVLYYETYINQDDLNMKISVLEDRVRIRYTESDFGNSVRQSLQPDEELIRFLSSI